jgi:hypothetical protein
MSVDMPSGGGDEPPRENKKRDLPQDRLEDLKLLRRRRDVLQSQLHHYDDLILEIQAQVDADRRLAGDLMEALQARPDLSTEERENLVDDNAEDIERNMGLINQVRQLRQQSVREMDDLSQKIDKEMDKRSKGEGLLPKKTIRKGGVVYYGTRSIKR